MLNVTIQSNPPGSTEELALFVNFTPQQITISNVSSGSITILSPVGVSGTNDIYDFVQNSPSQTWIINHNLGFKPDISCLSEGGVEIEGYIAHTNNNQAVVTFNLFIAGTAHCS